ncbi:MAG: hypothetical protein N4A48_04305 [Tepidibacter sp.]|jgi:multisubunit Na+/H+ antiporter MnhC subunit|uniref:hypothetical protein n=1 Tax=Tepidibacter sp. TaxID=2529387 RepID=UPI0025FB00EA|nr:hypothetical protein [Tepidibacter sp.]MCT4507973.1 hypothetical protein [Tepidibacter sp.]
MKKIKKLHVFLIINYFILFTCGIYVLISRISFFKFISRYLTLAVAINAILLIFFNLILKNINKKEQSIEISIPPMESELKDLLNNQTEDELEDEIEDEEFKEVNFENLNS